MNDKTEKWDYKQVYSTEISLENMLHTLEVLSDFQLKYPNDETITDCMDIIREEICHLFGGTICNNED